MCARIVSRRPRQLDRREIERQHNARLDLWLGGGNSPRRFAAHVRRPTDGYKAEDIGEEEDRSFRVEDISVESWRKVVDEALARRYARGVDVNRPNAREIVGISLDHRILGIP